MQKPKFQEALAAAQANQAGTATGPLSSESSTPSFEDGLSMLKKTGFNLKRKSSSGGFLGLLRKKLPVDMANKKSTLG